MKATPQAKTTSGKPTRNTAKKKPARKAPGKKPSRNGTRMAALADKYDLYQRSVQSPENEVTFFERTFKTYYRRLPVILREDFCAAAAVCCEWAKSGPDRVAIGVDLDPKPLAWGKKHNVSKLEPEVQSRVHLLKGDARDIMGPKADIIAAQNFSFYFFMTRDELRRYFRAAYKNLAREGLLVLDVLGGYECLKEDTEEVRGYRSFKYVWEQERFDPITHDIRFHIHFRFPDGSEMKRAFTYDWRMWTMPEIRELLAEAGFSRSDVYWEGTDPKTGRGNDVYRRRKHADSDPAWIAYLVAVK